MHTNTRSVETLTQIYRYIHTGVVLLIVLIVMCLPDFISNKIDMDLNLIRGLTFVFVILVEYHVTKVMHHLWLLAYNNTVEKEAYLLQQSLSDTLNVDVEDIDQAIDMLNEIKQAKVKPNK